VSTWNYDTPPTATRTGYDFAGWYTEPVGGTDFSSSLNGTVDIVSDTTLYAHWVPHTYKVHFNGNGSTGGSMGDQTLTYDVSANLNANAFTRSRHTWKGWSTNSDGTGAQYSDRQSVRNLTATNGAVINLYAKWERDYGYLDLKKSSGIAGITSGNGSYSLAGATFTVYSDAACTQSVGSFITDANGDATALHLPTEVYYIKETAAPAGYYMNDTKWTVEVYKDSTSWVRPSDDPGRISPTSGVSGGVRIAQKLDAQGVSPQGNGAVSGCQMTVRYYDNASGSTSGTPERTWVFTTDAEGGISYDAAHKVSGDALYVDGAGNPVLPIGSYTVTETLAPSGYCISDTGVHAFRVSLSSDHKTSTISNVNWSVSGTGAAYGGRGIRDEVVRGQISVTKNDDDFRATAPQGDATLAGAVFGITNRSAHAVVVDGQTFAPGELVMSITTGADGIAHTGSVLPYGTYDVVELSAPVGYRRNEAWSQRVTIYGDSI
jgi:uncharacterized repeat protein (TIGR02543 family)